MSHETNPGFREEFATTDEKPVSPLRDAKDAQTPPRYFRKKRVQLEKVLKAHKPEDSGRFRTRGSVGDA